MWLTTARTERTQRDSAFVSVSGITLSPSLSLSARDTCWASGGMAGGDERDRGESLHRRAVAWRAGYLSVPGEWVETAVWYRAALTHRLVPTVLGQPPPKRGPNWKARLRLAGAIRRPIHYSTRGNGLVSNLPGRPRTLLSPDVDQHVVACDRRSLPHNTHTPLSPRRSNGPERPASA